jgi:hypothetical protein
MTLNAIKRHHQKAISARLVLKSSSSLGLKLRSSERAKIALVKKVGVKSAFLVV